MSKGHASIETLIVGQSGGATPVINASLAGVIAEAQERGVRRILGVAFGVRGLLDRRFVELSALGAAERDALAQTPSAALGLCRFKLSAEATAQAVETLKAWRADAFLYIGGNDSAETTSRIAGAAVEAGYPLACIAVPKTIDNDLPAMDHTPGFGSAARFVASVTRDLGLDAWAMQREEQVRILEVYGRDTGWLTAASVLAREQFDDRDLAPHLVLAPECPFVEAGFLAAVERQVAGAGYCSVVVGEMLRDGQGALVGAAVDGWRDAFGHGETRRPGAYLRDLVQARLRLRAKDDRPGSIQKVAGDIASATDRAEAMLLGRAAVRAALAGETERIVTLERISDDPYTVAVGSAPLDAVAGQVRPLPTEFLDDRGQPNAAFQRYALPLIGAPLPRRVRLLQRLAQPV